ncbi:uncharacterized protein LOC135486478 [Lineus longissimus]|uniref:uncharacterized protein LOC135486478 n=1 Tax=Lineus longissimus TaxID=88925 RepID=UPI00315CD506
MASQNVAGIKVDDEVVTKFTKEGRMKNAPYKCLCMKFNDDKECALVVLDETNHVLKEAEDSIPDLDDYDARLPYEKKLFDDFVKKIMSDCPDSVRFFTWDFYFKSTSGTCKTKLGLIAWIPEYTKGRGKLCGASAKPEIEHRIDLKASVTVNDADDMDYMDLAKSLTLGFKN